MMLRPKEVVCKWVDAFNGHDVDAIVSLYHDNATKHTSIQTRFSMRKISPTLFSAGSI